MKNFDLDNLEQMEELGQKFATLLHLKPLRGQKIPSYSTEYGKKTNIGLARTILQELGEYKLKN